LLIPHNVGCFPRFFDPNLLPEGYHIAFFLLKREKKRWQLLAVETGELSLHGFLFYRFLLHELAKPLFLNSIVGQNVRVLVNHFFFLFLNTMYGYLLCSARL
jgi:hypothetical protein